MTSVMDPVERLSDEHAVERILVMHRQRCNMHDVLDLDGEDSYVERSHRLVDQLTDAVAEAELAGRILDRRLPDACQGQ